MSPLCVWIENKSNNVWDTDRNTRYFTDVWLVVSSHEHPNVGHKPTPPPSEPVKYVFDSTRVLWIPGTRDGRITISWPFGCALNCTNTILKRNNFITILIGKTTIFTWLLHMLFMNRSTFERLIPALGGQRATVIAWPPELWMNKFDPEPAFTAFTHEYRRVIVCACWTPRRSPVQNVRVEL